MLIITISPEIMTFELSWSSILRTQMNKYISDKQSSARCQIRYSACTNLLFKSDYNCMALLWNISYTGFSHFLLANIKGSINNW